MLKNPNSTLTNKKPQIDPNWNKWRLCVGVVWREARRHIEDFDVTVLVLLPGRALLVLANLPRRSHLWGVEWCSTTGGATIMAVVGEDAGMRGRPWHLLASTPVVESGTKLLERVARTMSLMEEVWR